MKNKYVTVRECLSPVHYGIGFNLELFSTIQSRIVNKYDAPEELSYSVIGSGAFIALFDKYLFHCIEEVIETRDEFKKGMQCKTIKEEMVDILLYLGSMNYIIKLNLEYFHMATDLNINLDYYTTKAYSKETFDSKLMEVIQLLVDQRRMFPQRKWHKPATEMPEIQMKYTLKTLYSKNINAMKIVLSLLLDSSLVDVNEINMLINTKQTFAIDLPIPE